MSGYIIRRIINSVPVVILLTILVFSMAHLMPGDPIETMIGENVAASPELMESLREEHGLNDPLPIQYANWLKRLATGDLGESISTGRPVSQSFRERLPVTAQLALISWVLAVGISLPLGIVAALHRNTWIDHAATIFALGGVAVPSFWMGLMFIIFFAVWADLLPPSGFIHFTENPKDAILHLILPAVTLGVHLTGSLTRQTRSAMLEVLHQDYVRTAQAKGLTPRRVVLGHAFRNATLPILTILGLQIALLVNGTVIVEQVFAIPGMGRLAIDAVHGQDIPVIQAVVLLAALTIVFSTLVTDVAYAIADPRIRL